MEEPCAHGKSPLIYSYFALRNLLLTTLLQASLLRSFYPSATTARGLIDHIALSQKTPVSNAGILLNLLDYGSLSEITPDQLTEQAYLTTQDQHIDVDTPSLTDMNTSDLCAMPRPELVTSPMHHFGAGAASKNFVYDLLGEDMGGVWMQMSSGDDGMQQA